MNQDDLKREVAEQAASFIEDGMVVGLGTGTTAAFFIKILIRRAAAGLRIACIPTSERSATQAHEGGLTLTNFATHKSIDIAVDGADEILAGRLDLVKGLGGALLREKIVASAAKKLVIIGDSSKMVDALGSKSPIPVEITQFGWELTRDRIAALGAVATLRLSPDNTPFLSDGRNYIIDARFPPITDPATLDRELTEIVGVVETGLFVGMTHLALVASETGITRYTT